MDVNGDGRDDLVVPDANGYREAALQSSRRG